MTVQELIDALKEIPDKGATVFTTWRDDDDQILRVEMQRDGVHIVPQGMYQPDEEDGRRDMRDA